MRRISFALLLVLLLAVPLASHAQTVTSRFLPRCALTDGNCNLTDMLQGFVNLAGYGLGLLAVVGVLMFVVGGFYLLLSAGRTSMITRGKAILAGATTGTLIVLFAYVFIGFIYVSLTGDTKGTIFKGTAFSFSFLKEQTYDYKCSVAIPKYLQVGCAEKDTNGPIHKAYILLNSKPGCWVGSVSGVYTPDLASVVEQFQENNGLTADGIIGPQTWYQIRLLNTSCTQPATPPPSRDGCCIPNDRNLGSCNWSYSTTVLGQVPPITDPGQFYSQNLCGSGFTYSGELCSDSSNGLTCGPVGKCRYVLGSDPGSGAGIVHCWYTTALACHATSGCLEGETGCSPPDPCTP